MKTKTRACQTAAVVLGACSGMCHAAAEAAKPEFQPSAREVREQAAKIERELIACNALLKLRDSLGS